jgi:hypothetical protein
MQVKTTNAGGYVALQAVLISLRGRLAGVKMGRGCLPTPVSLWEREPVKAVWRRGPTWKGHALSLFHPDLGVGARMPYELRRVGLIA